MSKYENGKIMKCFDKKCYFQMDYVSFDLINMQVFILTWLIFWKN